MNNQQKLHVAIIPDGNRRWAKRQLLKPWKGHERAAERFNDLMDWVREDKRIGVLTLWCFSTENWKRDPEEVEHLMKMFEDYLRKEEEQMIRKGVRVVHSGRTDRLSPSLTTILHQVMASTAQGNQVLHLALDYGGKDEIVRAISKIEDPKNITEEAIRANLDHPELPDIDLIIRTSGEQRTSNFCLWQSTYAEWMFIDTFFPDFSGDDLGKALNDFMGRQRRFGA